MAPSKAFGPNRFVSNRRQQVHHVSLRDFFPFISGLAPSKSRFAMVMWIRPHPPQHRDAYSQHQAPKAVSDVRPSWLLVKSLYQVQCQIHIPRGIEEKNYYYRYVIKQQAKPSHSLGDRERRRKGVKIAHSEEPTEESHVISIRHDKPKPLAHQVQMALPYYGSPMSSSTSSEHAWQCRSTTGTEAALSKNLAAVNGLQLGPFDSVCL